MSTFVRYVGDAGSCWRRGVVGSGGRILSDLYVYCLSTWRSSVVGEEGGGGALSVLFVVALFAQVWFQCM